MTQSWVQTIENSSLWKVECCCWMTMTDMEEVPDLYYIILLYLNQKRLFKGTMVGWKDKLWAFI